MLCRVQCRYELTTKHDECKRKEKWTQKIDDSNVNELNSFERVSERVTDTIFVMKSHVGSQRVHSFNRPQVCFNFFSKSEVFNKYLLLLSLWL